MYPKISEEGLLGSTYTKTSKVLSTSLVLDLIYPLGKSIILGIDESPTTHGKLKLALKNQKRFMI